MKTPNATVLLVLLSTTAAAKPGDVELSQATHHGMHTARVERPAVGTIGLAQTRTIYLNRTGVTLRPGNDDAGANTSSIISGARSVPAWNTSEANWNATVACFRDLWSRFDVTITEVDPGASVPHMEAVFGGSPQNIGMGQGVGGVSPFTYDCGVIEKSIVFTFTEVFPDDPRVICEVMAQEVAHSYGLDHEMLASDPMTYLNYTGDRAFQDQTAACGEYSNRQCGIGGSVCRANQNSVALLKDRVGAADLMAPELAITAPADGAMVAAGFAIEATATDDRGVAMATLMIDGAPAGMISGAGPYAFTAPDGLADGSHMVTVEVTDGRHTTTQTITVALGAPAGDGDGDGTMEPGAPADVVGGCGVGSDPVGALALALVLGLRRRRK